VPLAEIEPVTASSEPPPGGMPVPSSAVPEPAPLPTPTAITQMRRASDANLLPELEAKTPRHVWLAALLFALLAALAWWAAR
jgi:hypothetical protein